MTAKPVLTASLCNEEKRRGEKGLHPSMEQPVSEGKLRGADGGRPQGSHLHFASSLITAEPLKKGGFG